MAWRRLSSKWPSNCMRCLWTTRGKTWPKRLMAASMTATPSGSGPAPSAPCCGLKKRHRSAGSAAASGFCCGQRVLLRPAGWCLATRSTEFCRVRRRRGAGADCRGGTGRVPGRPSRRASWPPAAVPAGRAASRGRRVSAAPPRRPRGTAPASK